MKQKTFKLGFTLIELLIVIALLGALAIGLIGALDPFDQLKKGTDTGTRDITNQIRTAVIRYYSIKGWMPWCTSASSCGSEPAGVTLTTAPMSTAISKIIDAGELQSNFTTVHSTNLGKVFVTGVNSTGTLTVCYQPQSKSFKSEPNTKYDYTGGPGTSCLGTGGTSKDCYWCVQ